MGVVCEKSHLTSVQPKLYGLILHGDICLWGMFAFEFELKFQIMFECAVIELQKNLKIIKLGPFLNFVLLCGSPETFDFTTKTKLSFLFRSVHAIVEDIVSSEYRETWEVL